MANQAKSKTNSRIVVVVILILVVVFVGYFIYKSSSAGSGNSCTSLSKLYESAKTTEDYKKVSEYYNKMNELGCK